MKSKGKQVLFQSDYWNRKVGEVTHGKFWKWFLKKKTCRFRKHKHNASSDARR